MGILLYGYKSNIYEPHVKDAPNYYEGFGMYGAEISMPISKNIVLVIWDSQYFQEGLSNILCQ